MPNIIKTNTAVDTGAATAMEPKIRASTPRPTAPLSMKSKFSKVAISLPTSLLKKADHERGDTTRSAYIKDILVNAMDTRDEGMTCIKVKIPDRRRLEKYVIEKVRQDGGVEYSVYRRHGYRHPADGILFTQFAKLSQQEQVTFVDGEVSWLQGCLATDFFIGGSWEKEKIEEYLDLFLLARGEFLFYTCPIFKGIKDKLSSLGLDPKVYEKKCQEVMGYARGGEELTSHTGCYRFNRVNAKIKNDRGRLCSN
jgi:hypothetical protein